MYEYRVKQVVRVVDGDTYEVQLDVGFYLTFTHRFRLLGVDTPERREAGWAECRRFAQWWFTNALSSPDSVVLAHTEKADNFGRWLADFYIQGATSTLAVELQRLMDEYGWTSPAVRLG